MKERQDWRRWASLSAVSTVFVMPMTHRTDFWGWFFIPNPLGTKNRDKKLAPKTNMADNNNELDDAAAAVTVIAILAHEKSKNRKRKRSTWIQPWIENRSTHGAYHALLQELERTDNKLLTNFLRMDKNSFNLLLAKIALIIQQTDTHMRLSISPEERLALTLRYLATGQFFWETIISLINVDFYVGYSPGYGSAPYKLTPIFSVDKINNNK